MPIQVWIMVCVQDNVYGFFLSAEKDLWTEIEVSYGKGVWKSTS